MDIGWLQRDFGIYVVNMFDTGQAARVLNYGKYSLAFLLKKFCDVTANKQYQLADWRIRLESFYNFCDLPHLQTPSYGSCSLACIFFLVKGTCK